MQKIFHFAPLATVAIALVLTACNRSENAPTANAPAGPAVQDPDYAGFSKELTAIKVRETMPEEIDARRQWVSAGSCGIPHRRQHRSHPGGVL
jgi:hypothetical protein